MGRKAREKKMRRDGVLPAPPAEALKPRSQGPAAVSDSDFDRRVLRSELPVLVDFWAPWCGPCKRVAPVLDELSRELDGQVRIVKYNTEQNQRVARQMNIRSIPTMVLFNEGKVVDVKIGASNKGALSSWLERSLNPRPSLLGRLMGGASS